MYVLQVHHAWVFLWSSFSIHHFIFILAKYYEYCRTLEPKIFSYKPLEIINKHAHVICMFPSICYIYILYEAMVHFFPSSLFVFLGAGFLRWNICVWVIIFGFDALDKKYILYRKKNHKAYGLKVGLINLGNHVCGDRRAGGVWNLTTTMWLCCHLMWECSAPLLVKSHGRDKNGVGLIGAELGISKWEEAAKVLRQGLAACRVSRGVFFFLSSNDHRSHVTGAHLNR